jgi:hypothetical protein
MAGGTDYASPSPMQVSTGSEEFYLADGLDASGFS